jgi:hypothetical protein
VRNYAIFGVPLLSTITAEAFWRGNAPHSVGASYLPSGTTVLEAAPGEFRRALRSADESGQAKVFREAAFSSAGERPGAFLARLGRKFVTFWTFGPVSGLLYPRSYFHAYFAYYAVVVGLALLGAVRIACGRAAKAEAVAGLLVIVAAMLAVSIVQSVFYVELRHRWGVEPLLLVLSAVGLDHGWRLARRDVGAVCEARP